MLVINKTNAKIETLFVIKSFPAIPLNVCKG